MNNLTVSGKTSLVGLLGWPVSQSFSPAMHNAAFRSLNLDWLYLPLPVRAEGIGDALTGLKALGFVGANVTVPHKETIFQHLDHSDHTARLLGAVNTISIKDGEISGSNTDPAGFLMDCEEKGIELGGRDVLVLGAGGAARGVIYALAQAKVNSALVMNRTLNNAEVMVSDMSDQYSVGMVQALPLTKESFEAAGTEIDLVINTTSVGMAPAANASPWPLDVPMPSKTTYYDLVYRTRMTLFLERAAAAGARAVGGLGMLIHQGALSFKIWTGRQAPIDIMRQACKMVDTP